MRSTYDKIIPGIVQVNEIIKMSCEEFIESEFQYLVQEMRRMANSEFGQLQVPKSPCDQIQLRYLQNVRHFQLFEKGKSVDDRHPLEIKGKEGKESLFIKSRPPDLKITHKGFDGINSEKLPSFDLANYCSHINANDVDSKDAMKIPSYDMFYNDNSIDSVGFVHPVQIVNVCSSSNYRLYYLAKERRFDLRERGAMLMDGTMNA
ncbi:hypothetical protein PVK06_024904 [Gossypium arboreum]|uniref:Uncharacterized protein n=1 Tax=Gossypium arboreum TaxID=29729 RepID=A0ABR0PF52_GOSAR|nr:hypothetical protein PVK06_024904 [Gossypium arboreum]